ncbi:uncharacterized protein [Amphiura filiformis]|uniref:uncharacterized protein n=1 Tax=Amphiura filiformis TaxID=82378 RepID=UPI003B20DEC8
MASQLSGRWIMRWVLCGHHIKDTNNLLKLKYHTTTACLSDSYMSHKHDSQISSQHAPVYTSHHTPSKEVTQSRVNRSSYAKTVEELQHKISQLSVASPLPSGLYLSPLPNVQYKLPAHVKNELIEQIIVDPAVNNVVRECPTIVPDTEIEDPRNMDNIIDMPPFREESTKQAKITNIILIRRKKMRKHKLKKLRKRMKYLTRLILTRRKKKKRKLWEAHLEKFKFKELTDEMIEEYMARINIKREYMTRYMRSEAGLSKKTKVKVIKQPPPPAGPITPTPILPPGAMRK